MIDKYHILGIKIDAINHDILLKTFRHWINKREKKYVVLTGVHGIIEMQNDFKLKQINNNSDLTTPDGMPTVWIGKLKGYKHIEKVYAPDIMLNVFKDGVDKGYRHFFYGGKDGVAENLKNEIEKLFPGIKIVGTYCPPFRDITLEEEKDIVMQIEKSKADIVWVGLGCPKQENWVAHFRPLLTVPVLIGVGAGFDFLSGEKPLASNFLKNSGFEWFFRLLSDPKRLWPRYSRIVPKFIYLYLLELLRIRKYPKEDD